MTGLVEQRSQSFLIVLITGKVDEFDMEKGAFLV
jgi:hypothetical protein